MPRCRPAKKRHSRDEERPPQLSKNPRWGERREWRERGGRSLKPGAKHFVEAANDEKEGGTTSHFAGIRRLLLVESCWQFAHYEPTLILLQYSNFPCQQQRDQKGPKPGPSRETFSCGPPQFSTFSREWAFGMDATVQTCM